MTISKPPTRSTVLDAARRTSPAHRRPSARRGPLGVLAQYPLVSFVVLANAMSWLGWLPYVLSHNGLGVWNFRFPELLGTSQLLGVLPGAYLGPIASALLVTAVADGRAGLRRWAARMWRWRVSPRWYVLTLLGVPAAMLTTGLAFSGGQASAPPLVAAAAYVPALLLQIATTGLAEEPGWRDFALPRLQARFSPLAATMVLGPVWAVWHLPLFFTEWGGWPNAGWTRPVAFLVFCLGFNIVMTWVFNRTGQSLPLSMLAHVSVNNTASVLWAEMFPGLDADQAMPAMATGAVVAGTAILLATRGRLGYRVDEPAVQEDRSSGRPRRLLLLWLLLAGCLAGNVAFSLSALPAAVGATFGFAALAVIVVLILERRRHHDRTS